MPTNKSLSIDEIRTCAEKILAGRWHFILLLGSAGTERFHAESDIDLVAYFITSPDTKILMRLGSDLTDVFGVDCDFVKLNDIDPIFARQVLETGREVSVPDRAFFNIWKAQQLSIYPDFKRSRKVIEENLLNRKKYV